MLLLDPDRKQSAAALAVAEEFLDVRQVQWHKRDDTRLREACPPADVLLNFLSAPKVTDLGKFRLAINFHPAPPEYPGVGSATLALYDKRTEHGVTAHLMTPKYDDGIILRVRRFPITTTHPRELFARALDESLVLFREVVLAIAKGEPLRTTNEEWTRKAYTRREFEGHPSFT